jgi:NAD(P)-dependent dehydrogenase (short-subunit alcohol dehydrogenase family)
LFDLAKQKFGKIDIVVNNAGIIEKTPFITNVQDDWIKVVEIDFNSVVLGTRLALAEFEKQNSPGVILNTASLAGLVPTSFQPVYAAVKAGVVHFSRSLGYLGKKGIRVNCICPSFVKTALTKEALEKGYPIPNWVELDLVIDAFMMAIQDDTLAGEAIRITPERGIDVPFRKIPKAKL